MYYERELSKKLSYFLKGINRKRYCNCLTIYHSKNKYEQIWYSSYRINDVSDFILKHNSIVKGDTENNINKIIINIVGNILLNDKDRDVSHVISKFIKKWKKLKISTYYCTVSISPDLILKNKMHFNEFTLIPPRLKNKEVREHVVDDVYEEYKDYTKNNFPCCSLRVKAINYDSAKLKAMQMIRLFLGTIIVLKDNPSLKYCIKIGPSLYSDYGYECLAYSKTNDWQLSQNPYFTKAPLIFNISRISSDEKLYLNDISLILTKISMNRSISKLERNLINANKLIAEGLMSPIRTTRIIKYMSSIEALLESNKGHINEQMRTKVPYLLSDNYNQRIVDWKNMKYLYSLRSNISHGGYQLVLGNDIDTVFYIAKAVLATVFHKYFIKNLSLCDLQKFFKRNKKSRIAFDRKNLKRFNN